MKIWRNGQKSAFGGFYIGGFLQIKNTTVVHTIQHSVFYGKCNRSFGARAQTRGVTSRVMDDVHSFEVESCIRGHHVYKESWNPFIGEELDCRHELSNPADTYAVATMRDAAVVGHIPRKISAICALFLRSGTLRSIVSGSRRYSSDLPNGGLEVPCRLIFKGSPRDIVKIQKFFSASAERKSLSTESKSDSHEKEDTNDKENEQPNKKRKLCVTTDLEVIDVDRTVSSMSLSSEEPWLKYNRYTLNTADKAQISSGHKLTDKHINFAQAILKNQFNHLSGLQSTLLAKQSAQKVVENVLQIIYCEDMQHWIVASTITSFPTVLIFDSSFSSINRNTFQLLRQIFGSFVDIQMGNSPRQEGCDDCGAFAIATSTSLAFGKEPGNFVQERMRDHLLQCFEKDHFTHFPCN